MAESTVELSVIISISVNDFHEGVKDLYNEYKKSIESSGLSHEFIFVTDAESSTITDELNSLVNSDEKVKIVKLAKWFGDAAALNAGFEQADGAKILTLPAYKQIDNNEIPNLIQSFSDEDMLIASRARVKDRFFHRLQARIFHYIVKLSLGMNFSDLGCKVRIFSREVLEKVYLYGDQHRFLPLLASRYGFQVRERKVSSYYTDSPREIYSFGHYTERIVDLISIFFLIKFTKKPLRFFGFPGFIIFIAGCIIALYLFIERVIFDTGLADRPIVLVSILLIVFGIQLFAIGLVAEIIIFTHSKESKDYIIDEIIQSGSGDFQREPKIKIGERV